MSRVVVEGVAPEAWDAVVEALPDHTVFHSRAWLEVVAEVHGLELLLRRAQVDGGTVAAWPALAQRKGPLRIVGSPLPGWSTAYLGPLFAPGVDPASLLPALLGPAGLGRWSYLQCRVLDRDRAIDLRPLGFTPLRREETYLLDLRRSEEALWSGLASSCRRQVRKAQRLGVETVVESGDQWQEDFAAMSGEVFARSGIRPTYRPAFTAALHRRLGPAGRVHVVSARLGGRRIATLVLPHDARTMYYWAGASRDDSRDVPASNLLHWEAILHARSLGLRTYDFISTKGGPGRFKKTFGPEAVEVATHWEASRTRLIAWAKRHYEAHARRRRRVA